MPSNNLLVFGAVIIGGIGIHLANNLFQTPSTLSENPLDNEEDVLITQQTPVNESEIRINSHPDIVNPRIPAVIPESTSADSDRENDRNVPNIFLETIRIVRRIRRRNCLEVVDSNLNSDNVNIVDHLRALNDSATADIP